MVDGLEDPGAPLLDVGERSNAAPVPSFHKPGTNTDGDDQSKKNGDDHQEVAHAQPWRLGDDYHIVEIANEDIERHFAVEGIGVGLHANAGDANARAQGNLFHG